MSERDIETENRVWVRMFGEDEAERLRMNAEVDRLLSQIDDPDELAPESDRADD